MSVVVITKFPGARVDKLEEVAFGRYEETMKRIAEDGRSKGAIHHLFADDGNGNVLVIDEWRSLEDFNRFFSAEEDIGRVTSRSASLVSPPRSNTVSWTHLTI